MDGDRFRRGCRAGARGDLAAARGARLCLTRGRLPMPLTTGQLRDAIAMRRLGAARGIVRAAARSTRWRAGPMNCWRAGSAGPAHGLWRSRACVDGTARLVQRIENFCPVPSRLRRLRAQRPAARDGRPALRRAGRDVQGEDQFQDAGRRRLQAASGPAGRLDALCPAVHHRAWSRSTTRPSRMAAWRWRRPRLGAACWGRSGSR